MQKASWLWVALLAASCSASRENSATSTSSLSKKQQKDGWVMLFDGKTKSGWHIFNHTSDGAAWKAADGVLYLDPKDGEGGGDLVTDKEYENYDLKMDWKISKNGNSGIIFQVQEDPKFRYTWVTGPEMQVIDNDGHPDAKYVKHRAGDLYDLMACSKEVAHPAEEWNQAEIVVNHGKLDLYLNGAHVVSTTQWDATWKNLIDSSKFKGSKDFGQYKKGKIALQDHGGDAVYFRNIMIREL